MRKVLGIDKDISISDEIDIILETKNDNDCLSDPYKVDKVTIFFVSREFFDQTFSEYEQNIFDENLLKEYKDLKKIACEIPSQENLNKLKFLENKIETSKLTSKFFFKEATPVKVFGGAKCENWESVISCTPADSEFFPAWLNPDLVPSDLKEKVSQDNILEKLEDGKFLLKWVPYGMREGDYFICWTWQPNIAGDTISSHMFFSLDGSTQLTTALPTHQTNPEKYKILMERYLPELFKTFVSSSDLTPYVLQELNNSVGKGFHFLEDLANQIIDLLDSNSIHEQFLPVLSNLFNLGLKSNDPTLWRRQIKKSIPNFKKKGTIGGLKEAFGDAGYELLKVTRLWQILSKYTYQESFEFNDELEFELSKRMILPVDLDNFKIWILKSDSSEWIEIDSSYVSFEEQDQKTTMSWEGGGEEFEFEPKDYIRIIYKIKEIPSEQEQQYENYVRDLSLMDLRDERDQKYPPKNWNTYLIEEDDPLFNVLIPVRHPFHDPLIWGQIRTEFPYSENAYNMDEYNGSTRDSLDPCDIDKNFIDPCGDCQSSKLTIDVAIEELSNDRIKEAENIFYEYVPFHSLVHSINYNGIINEFVKPPVEEITTLISYFGQEITLSGEAQHIFNRAIPYDEAIEVAKRDMLSTMVPATESLEGKIKNSSIILIAPSSSEEDLNDSSFKNATGITNFKLKGINTASTSESNPFDNSNLLQIIAPSINAGFYSVSNITKHHVEITSGVVNQNPLSKKQFAFKLFNKLHEQNISIEKRNKYIIKNQKLDELVSFEQWTLKITSENSTNFNIVRVVEVMSNGDFVVEDDEINGEPVPGSVPLGQGPSAIDQNQISWRIYGVGESLIFEGTYNLTFQAKIIKSSESVVDFGSYKVSNFKIGDVIFYDENQYPIKRIVDENKVSINLNEGDASGVVSVYRTLFENCVGQFDYLGLELETEVNHEEELGIQNGDNPVPSPLENDQFKENYLILINNKYYVISEIDQNRIILNGPNDDWTLSGTDVDYIIYKFNKESISISDRINPPIKGHNFDYKDDPPKGLGGHVDRSGSEVVYLNTKTYSTILNSMNNKENIIDLTEQQEQITYEIEYKEDLENE